MRLRQLIPAAAVIFLTAAPALAQFRPPLPPPPPLPGVSVHFRGVPRPAPVARRYWVAPHRVWNGWRWRWVPGHWEYVRYGWNERSRCWDRY